MNDLASKPVRFWHEYKTKADGSIETREYVEIARPMMQHAATNCIRITDKVKAAPGWDTIAPYYDAWTKGNEAPEIGTPLGAWPGLTQEQVQIFKACGIRTVEEIAGMTDKVMNMVKLPNIRHLKMEADTFLKAKDQRGTEIKLQQQAEEIAALKAMIEEMADARVIDAPKRKRRTKAEMLADAQADEPDEETQEDQAA